MTQAEPIKILPWDCTCEHLEKDLSFPVAFGLGG